MLGQKYLHHRLENPAYFVVYCHPNVEKDAQNPGLQLKPEGSDQEGGSI